MYIEHPEFVIDKSKNIPFWRYMDFWKFLDLLNSTQLFFANFEILGDQHEGKIPEEIYKMMEEKEMKKGYAEVKKDFIEKNLRRKTFVSSWNANKTESFAMWKMYSKDKLGVAIKTNFEKLKESFKETSEDIYIGKVSYYNNKNPKFNTKNSFCTFLNKHNYYKFESEVRCITIISDDDDSTYKKIKINLNTMIEEVYISPYAQEYGLIEILEMLKGKYNLNFEIKISGVNDIWL